MKFLMSLTLSFIVLTQTVSVFAIGGRPISGPNAFDDPPAPSSSPTPDPELEEAKRSALLAEEKKKKAEAEKAEAEAQRAKLKAETEAFGDPSKVTVPSGGVQTDSEGFVEVKMLSLEAAREITQRLTLNLCKPIKAKTAAGAAGNTNIENLVIYNDRELGAVVLYRSMITRLQYFNTEFDRLEGEFAQLESRTNPKTNSADPQPVTGATTSVNASSALAALAIPGVATGIITSIAQLVNLFRTDTNFQNKAVDIPEDMVVSYVVQNLNSGLPDCKKPPAVYYPHLYPAGLFEQSQPSQLLAVLGEIEVNKGTAADNIKKIEARLKLISDIAGAIKEKNAMAETVATKQKAKALLLKTDPRCRKAACTKITAEILALNSDIKDATDAINEATTNSQAGFERKSPGWVKSLKRLQALIQFQVDSADQITNKLDTPDEATRMTPFVQLLRAEQLAAILNKDTTFMLRVAVSANGTTKIKKNIFVDAKVRHSAGANLVYQLFDRHGRVVMGDAMQFYFDYKSATEVRDQVAKGQGEKAPTSQAEAPAAVASKRQ